ncbi:unnamed protein product [Rhizophagus irregularis]|nr:unnamed protein product [Rhizophagus irregularis]
MLLLRTTKNVSLIITIDQKSSQNHRSIRQYKYSRIFIAFSSSFTTTFKILNHKTLPSPLIPYHKSLPSPLIPYHKTLPSPLIPYHKILPSLLIPYHKLLPSSLNIMKLNLLLAILLLLVAISQAVPIRTIEKRDEDCGSIGDIGKRHEGQSCRGEGH